MNTINALYPENLAALLPRLETPSVLIDMERVRRNLASMQKICDGAGVALRPHIKTHKISEFARMQLTAGAKGVTCAKVSEAEVMADGGCGDIFIAYPLVGSFRIARAVALARRIDRLILAVDSAEGAAPLDEAARAAGLTFEVRLEVETGARRTGVRSESLLATARAVAAMKGLRLTGIYTFKSLSMADGSATADNAASGEQEGVLLGEAAALLRQNGIPIEDVSGGSTPTGPWVARTGKVTEIRPGTYIFKDYMLMKEGVAQPEDVAAFVAVTVVSTPCEEYAVVDGGTKVFPTDIALGTTPYYYDTYAKPVGSDDLVLTRLSEEHGMLYSKSGRTGLTVGQKLLFYPGHVCTTVNLRNEVYLADGTLLRRVRVEARGMSV